MALEKLIDQEDDESALDELKPGTKLLHGQYTISRYLNSGGFGITYLAKDSLDRDVVIKECYADAFCRRTNAVVSARSRAHQGELKSIIKHFVQEAQSLSKLVHPNIVGVHQVFEDNDTAYMAIDFVDGQDLLEILEDPKQTLEPEHIVTITRKLLAAIGFIHDHSLLHRDISPDNILLDRAGEPILIDFGAARENIAMSSKKHSALRVVKDGYSPQEFYITGSDQGPWSDLYAFAASLYHAVKGEPPVNGQNRLVAIAEQRADPYEPLAGAMAGYPDGFLEAIDKALITMPAKRIQSAKEWLEMLDNPSAALNSAPAATGAKRKTSKMFQTIDGASAGDGTQNASPKKLIMAGLALAIVAVLGFVGYNAYDTQQAEIAAVKAEGERIEAEATAARIAADAEADAVRVAQQAETTRLAAEAEAARIAAEAASSRALAEAEAARIAAETEASRVVAEAEAARVAAQADAERAAAEVEAARIATQNEAARVTAEIEAAELEAAETAARVAAEADSARVAAEVEAARLAAETARAAAEQEAIRQAADAAAAGIAAEINAAQIAIDTEAGRRAAEAEAVRQAEADEAALQAAADQAARIAAEAEVTRIAQEQSAAVAAADIEAGRRAAEEEAMRQAAQAEQTALRAQTEQSDGPVVETPDPTARTDTATPTQNRAVKDATSVMSVAQVDLPFVASSSDPAAIGTVAAGAPAWLRTGQKIVSVNGVPVASIGEIQTVVSATSSIGTNDGLVVELGVADQISNTATLRGITLPVVEDVALLNGMRFQSRLENGAWVTRVIESPGTRPDEFHNGDIIVAYVATNETIDTRGGLTDLLQREVSTGTSNFNFAVNRNDAMWLVTMQYDSAIVN